VLNVAYKKCGRYTQNLYNAISELQELKQIPQSVQNGIHNELCDLSICFTNKKVNEINLEMYNRWLEMNTDAKMFKLLNKDKINTKWHVGMPIICYTNIKSKKCCIFNSQRYVIEGFDDDNIYLQNQFGNKICSRKQFNGNFKYGFCATTHKIQGLTINKKYNIYETEMMSLNVIYTAISRGTCRYHIGIDKTCKIFELEQNFMQTSMVDSTIEDTIKGAIFTLTDTDGDAAVFTSIDQQDSNEIKQNCINTIKKWKAFDNATIKYNEIITSKFNSEKELAKAKQQVIQNLLNRNIPILNNHSTFKVEKIIFNWIAPIPIITEIEEPPHECINRGKTCFRIITNNKRKYFIFNETNKQQVMKEAIKYKLELQH